VIAALCLTERAMPDGRYRELEGQTHDVAPQVLAPVLIEELQAVHRRRQAGKGTQAAAA
jgi:hypothetical protein